MTTNTSVREKIERILEHEHDRHFCRKEILSLFQELGKEISKQGKPRKRQYLDSDPDTVKANMQGHNSGIDEMESNLLQLWKDLTLCKS